MKKLLLSLCLLFTLQNCLSQDKKIKPFFEGSFRTTFAINEDFTLSSDDDQGFLHLTGTFFRLGVGFQFGRRFLISVNGGYDHHFPYSINAFPTYAKVRFNIWENLGDQFFIQYSRGKMWRPSDRFSDGDYYNAGLGWELESDSRWKPVILLGYHRKKIQGFESSGNLDSISLGIGFRFF